MISLQEWRKYVNHQIEETITKKKRTEEKEEKPKGIVPKKIDLKKTFEFEKGKEKLKEVKSETPEKDSISSTLSKEVPTPDSNLPTSDVDPVKILTQRDKKPKSVPPPKIEETPLIDPAKILVQKDKPPKLPDEQKSIEFPTVPRPEQKELPLPEVKIEGIKIKEEKVSRKSLQKREELIKRLLDPLITLEETALLLNVCKATVRRYTDNALLPHIRTAGGQRRFRLSDVITFVEKRESKVKEEKDKKKPEENKNKEDETITKLKEQQEKLKEINQVDLAKDNQTKYDLTAEPKELEKILDEKKDPDLEQNDSEDNRS